MGLRLCPFNGQPLQCGGPLALQATSAETNAASIASFLGMPVKVLSSFVQGHPFSDFIRSDLLARGMDVEGPSLPQGGPWGLRHQINLADSGFGSRGPRVWNDRAGEVGRCLDAADFDLERIFSTEGVRIMHLSGLIAALAPQFCLDLVDAAGKYSAKVSFDINYRASFWAGQEDRLREAFSRIASAADILVGNEEDFQLALGLEGPEAGGRGLTAKELAFREMLGRVRERFPRARTVATTLREVKDAGTHLWGAIVSAGDECVCIPPREIKVLDRIGGGDGFTGGLLYGLLKSWPPEKCAQFAWASGALAVTYSTDYARPADEAQIWSVWEGNARVVR